MQLQGVTDERVYSPQRAAAVTPPCSLLHPFLLHNPSLQPPLPVLLPAATQWGHGDAGHRAALCPAPCMSQFVAE